MSMMDWRLSVLMLVLLTLAVAAVRIGARRRNLMTTRQLIGVDLDDSAFQQTLKAALRQQGYQIEESAAAFVVMRRSGETTLLSCLGWNRRDSARKRLRRLARAIRQQHAAGGKLVSAQSMPSWFQSHADAHSVEWIGPNALADLLSLGLALEPARTVQLVTSFIPDRLPAAELETELPRSDAGQKCPRCGSAMTLQVADQGGAQGLQFWRCVRSNECKGIRTAKQA
jgi:ssDNA-binding Zn-finger/Zn-ribbon topoisomerase 1